MPAQGSLSYRAGGSWIEFERQFVPIGADVPARSSLCSRAATATLNE